MKGFVLRCYDGLMIVALKNKKGVVEGDEGRKKQVLLVNEIVGVRDSP